MAAKGTTGHSEMAAAETEMAETEGTLIIAADEPPTSPCCQIEREPGLVEKGGASNFYGWEDTPPKLLTYDPSAIRSLLAPFISADLTVCNTISTWSAHVLTLVYAVLLMILLANNAMPDGIAPALHIIARAIDVWHRTR